MDAWSTSDEGGENGKYEQQCLKTYFLTCLPKHIQISMLIRELCILGYLKWAQWRFWSDSANALADLNLRWVHMSEGTFSTIVVSGPSNQSLLSHEVILYPWLSKMYPVKIPIRLCECAGWSDLRWAHMSEGTFSHVVAHTILIVYQNLKLS